MLIISTKTQDQLPFLLEYEREKYHIIYVVTQLFMKIFNKAITYHQMKHS